MKNRWKQRRLALATALVLALPALGMAEEAGGANPSEPMPSEPVIYAEAVESVEEQGALELGELPAGVPGEDYAVEPADPGDEGEPEEPDGLEVETEPAADGSAAETEAAPGAEAVPEAAPEAAPAPGAEAGLMEGEAAEVVTAFSFPKEKLSMGKGERRMFAARLPAGYEGVTVTYASSKPSVVKVNAEGKLTARKKGTAKITATASNGEVITCKVKVVKAPSKVKLKKKNAIIGLEEALALTAKLPKGSASAITWTSDDPAIATVDENGVVRGVGAGAVYIRATTFNGKRAKCAVTVLGGHTPTSVSLPAKTVKLGQWETYQIAPILGEGEAALFTFSSSKRKNASVTEGGLVTARKIGGSSTITVKTHNGLSCKLTVKVLGVPTEVTLSETSLTLEAGASAKLTAAVTSNTASEIAWSSSDPGIAAVDGSGNVTAVAPGEAQIVATTYNGLTAACVVTVTEPKKESDDPVPAATPAEMVANLRASKALGGKKDAICSVAELLMSAGYEPAFAAGVCANVYSEGNYGFFESSKYVSNYLKRPRYFCYLDGGDYYKLQNGEYVLTAVYLSQEEIDAYTGTVEARLRYGEEKYYWNHWSGKYVYNIDLNELQAFMDALTAGNWTGKFGLGVTQWTGGRTRKLMAFYRKYAGEGNPTITKEQVIAAENDMILYDLQGDYKKVYTSWKSENKGALNCTEAARSAGSIVCLKYEIPANKETSAVKRGNNAAKFYDIMVGAK